MRPVATYHPASPARAPGTVTLVLEEELALYVLGVLGIGNGRYGADPSVPGDAEFDLFVKFIRALREGGVPDVDERSRRHGDAHRRFVRPL